MHSLFKFINFAIFIGILYYFLKKPVKQFWRNRRTEISGAISAAGEVYHNALSAKALVDSRLKGIEGEIESLRREFLSEGRYKKDNLVEAAKVLADNMVRDSKLVIEHETKKASFQLKEFAVGKAIRVAEERLVKEMGSEEKARFLSSAQREIESGI